MHAVNTVALLIEFGTDRMLIPVQQLLLYLAWGVAYILFEWAIHPFTSGRASAHPTGWADKAGWAYPFLRLDALAPLWYGGVLASSALLYGVFRLLATMQQHRALQPEQHTEGQACAALEDLVLVGGRGRGRG